MKKVYETPAVEKVEFRYRDQVVATSGINSHECKVTNSHLNSTSDTCTDQSETTNPSTLQ